MAAPKVSIIVPVFNTEKYLRQCIDSIIAQTLEDIEIIIVDDGSREKCALLCDELAKCDARIKVIHKANGGLGFARNSGMEASCGEYVGFVDSDDYINPFMYESLYVAAVKNDADLVLSGTCFVDGNTFKKAGEHIEKKYFEKEEIFEEEGMNRLLLGVVGALPHESDDSRYGVSVCKNLFKRSLLCKDKIEFFSERQIICEDTLFMVDYIKRARKAVGIPGAFYCYRRNDESLSKSYKIDRFEKTMFFLSVLEEHINDTLSKNEYGLYLDRLIQGFGRVLCSQEIVYARDNGIKFGQLCQRLDMICAHEKIRNVLKTYPWHKLPKKQAAFAFAMRYRLYFLQKLMVIFRAR